MVFFVLVIVIMIAGMILAQKISPMTERLMSCIWKNPTYDAHIRVAKRVKELCVDSDVPVETAAMMIAKENNIMEEQVHEMMRVASANPFILRMAFGSRAGNIAAQVLKKYRLLGD
jgi:arginine/lysine/ornithine decarboxylase